MLKKNKVFVVVPAYNEEKMIGKVIETMPRFVDLIIVVNDKSKDKTVDRAESAAKRSKAKLMVVNQEKNQGVGAAISRGFETALKLKADVVAVMAGDAQMNPDELESIVGPIINNEADFVKGNRLIFGQAWRRIPRVRYLGNSVLSLLTKIVSGYWHVADSQTGYVAISKEVLKRIDIDSLYKKYGFPNDLLVHLNVANARVKEIPIEPIYNANGKSGIRLWKVIPNISWLLLRRFFWRLKRKYIIDDFHPLVFSYMLSFLLSLLSIFFLVRLIWVWAEVGRIPPINALVFVFCVIMASQFLLFAMWFDMDYNKDLRIK